MPLFCLFDPDHCTDAQWDALGRIWASWDSLDGVPFHRFLLDVWPSSMGCLMVRVTTWWGTDMWLGVEPDGYTHS
jgi:hypothetical protein